MTEGWQKTILETHGLVQRIDERTEKTDKAVDVLFKKVNGHETRIDTLETQEAVLEERSKWQRMKPYAIGGSIGTVSLGTLAGIAYGALTYLGVI